MLGFDLVVSLIDVISNTRVDILFAEWYKHASELAQKISVNEVKPRVCFKQTNRKNYNANSIADYYKVSLTIPLTKIVLQILKEDPRETKQCTMYHNVNNVITM